MMDIFVAVHFTEAEMSRVVQVPPEQTPELLIPSEARWMTM